MKPARFVSGERVVTHHVHHKSPGLDFAPPRLPHAGRYALLAVLDPMLF